MRTQSRALMVVAVVVLAACSSSNPGRSVASSTTNGPRSSPATIPTPANFLVARREPDRSADGRRLRRIGRVVADRSREVPDRSAARGRPHVVLGLGHPALGLPIQHRRRWGRRERTRPCAEAVPRRHGGAHVPAIRECGARARVDRLRQQRAAEVHDQRQVVRRQPETRDGRRVRASTWPESCAVCTTETTSRCSSSAR